jgi:hypothetical protein
VGDDLFVTNVKRLREGMDRGVADPVSTHRCIGGRLLYAKSSRSRIFRASV